MDNKNKTILLTGATDGIGRITALKLAQKGAHLILHGRDKEKLDETVKEISMKSGNNNIDKVIADFSLLDEVKRMAEDINDRYYELHILINNAGAGFSDKRYSKDGYELRFTVNYLAPFLLTQLLLPMLEKSAPSRIVNVSSAGQRKLNFDDIMMKSKFDPVYAYAQSKLALIMYTLELAEKLRRRNIMVNALHPGTYLNTKMVRNAGINPWGDPETGADAEVYLALSPELDRVTGKYFDGKKESLADSQAYNAQARKRLWHLSVGLTNLERKENEHTS